MEWNENENLSDTQMPSDIESLPKTVTDSEPEAVQPPQNDTQPQETAAPVQEPAAQIPPKKESPFADSPYCLSGQPTAPVKKKKTKKAGKCHKGVVIGLSAALALTIVGSSAAVISVQNHYSNQMMLMQESLEKKIGALEEKLQAHSDSVIGAAPSVEGALTPNQVYVKNVKAVVSVECEYKSEDDAGEEQWGTGGGSGFTVTEDGYILTNSHVIADAVSVAVRFSNGEVMTAEVIGDDPANDVALLKVEGQQLPVVEFGSSDALVAGDQVVVIGYPLFTNKPVLTAGYVSAKDQVISPEGSGSMNTIQIDAAINSGNSGGPVFNALGQVIGIAVAKESGLSSTGASIEGVGYTVPIDDALRILPDLYEFGYVKSGFLGVMVRDVDLNAQSYGLPAGAFVAEATFGHAAYKGGVQERDIITGVDGAEVVSMSDLTRILQKYKAGQKVVLEVWRNGETVYLNVVLEEKPQTPSDGTQEPQNENNPSEDGLDDFLRPFFEGKP